MRALGDSGGCRAALDPQAHRHPFALFCVAVKCLRIWKGFLKGRQIQSFIGYCHWF